MVAQLYRDAINSLLAISWQAITQCGLNVVNIDGCEENVAEVTVVIV